LLLCQSTIAANDSMTSSHSPAENEPPSLRFTSPTQDKQIIIIKYSYISVSFS